MTMINVDCAEARDLIELHTDGELSVEEHAAMAAHIAGCEECRAELEAIEALRARIKTAGFQTAPSDLKTRVLAALDAESQRPLAADALWRRYGRMAASYFAIAVLSGGLVYGVITSNDANDRAVREAVNAHVRAGMAGQLVQVASSDMHTVKPWLAARLPFSPDVKDFAAQGFPLIGGRVDYLLDKPVASLVYMRRQHPITVFVVPNEDAAALSGLAADRNGYRVASWRDGASVYIATSDVGPEDFNELIGLLKGTSTR
jgi:anti-sigma factor (TIGR02949 family)